MNIGTINELEGVYRMSFGHRGISSLDLARPTENPKMEWKEGKVVDMVCR